MKYPKNGLVVAEIMLFVGLKSTNEIEGRMGLKSKRGQLLFYGIGLIIEKSGY